MGFKKFYEQFIDGVDKISIRQDKLGASQWNRTGFTTYNEIEEDDFGNVEIHAHAYEVNADGDGVTDSVTDNSGEETHCHKIKGWKVEEADDHSHQLQSKSEAKKTNNTPSH